MQANTAHASADSGPKSGANAGNDSHRSGVDFEPFDPLKAVQAAAREVAKDAVRNVTLISSQQQVIYFEACIERRKMES